MLHTVGRRETLVNRLPNLYTHRHTHTATRTHRYTLTLAHSHIHTKSTFQLLQNSSDGIICSRGIKRSVASPCRARRAY